VAHDPRDVAGTLAGRAIQAREGVPDLAGGTWAYRMNWSPRATEHEDGEWACEVFFTEFEQSREPHEVELMKRELLKIHRKSPGISYAPFATTLEATPTSRLL
jgi:hypothetical protein